MSSESFPQSNVGMDGKPEKKNNDFKQFLVQQFSLPKEQWSKEFKNYVEKKYKEAHPNESPDLSLEQEREETFKRYLEVLNISEENLKGKKILDIGCGEEAEFVKRCLNENITQEIYGLDMLEIDTSGVQDDYKKNLLKGDVAEKLPVNELDYVLSVGVPLAPISEKEMSHSRLEETIENSIEALNKNGEARFYPIPKASPYSSEMPGFEFQRKNWLEAMEKVSKNKEIEWGLEPIDIGVSGFPDNKDVWLNEVLIIKKQGEK